MEFLSDTIDYSVPEFFERFSHELPKMVTVSQGFYGDILQDTFDRNQVLRIHTFSRQPRVIAQKTVEGAARSEFFSIPLDYPIPLCVVKQFGKVGKERSLEYIVTKYHLPVTVQFSKTRKIPVGTRIIHGANFPQLTLTDTFDEIYMLANFLCEGVVQLKPEVIPLYLTEMRLAEVVGMKGQPYQKWLQYADEVTAQVTHSVTFDLHHGNRDIAIYNPETIKPDTIYAHTAPSKYTSIDAILKQGDPMYASLDNIPAAMKSDNLYEPLSEPPNKPKESSRATPKSAGNGIHVPKLVMNLVKSKSAKSPFPELEEKLKQRSLTSEGGPSPPPIAPKPTFLSSSQPLSGQNPSSPTMCNPSVRSPLPCGSTSFSPPLPSREPKKLNKPKGTTGSHTYKNAIPRLNVPPRIQESPSSEYDTVGMATPGGKEPQQDHVTNDTVGITSPAEKRLQQEDQTYDTVGMAPSDGKKPQQGRPDYLAGTLHTNSKSQAVEPPSGSVSSMTISRLCEWMDYPRLSKYVAVFEREMIDGNMLLLLDEETLQNEFGMTKLESIRLMSFARTGHVPT